jgi:hypothetical protein
MVEEELAAVRGRGAAVAVTEGEEELAMVRGGGGTAAVRARETGRGDGKWGASCGDEDAAR